jgi:hypothetical protein
MKNPISNVVTASASLERSVSSVSNDYVLIDPAENKSSVNMVAGKEPPLVISVDTNDKIITESVTIDSSKPTSHGIFDSIASIVTTESHADPLNVTHEAVKPKFVIVGGMVQRAQDISKQDNLIHDGPRSHASETGRPLKDIVRVLNNKKSHPQRKKPKKTCVHKKKISVSGASEGWSTEDEESDTQTTSLVQNLTDLPGMLTDVSLSVPTDVFALIRLLITRRLLSVPLKLWRIFPLKLLQIH